MHLKHALSKAFKKMIIFCEIWVLTPSFLGTPLRSHYQIFSPQIMQEIGIHIAL